MNRDPVISTAIKSAGYDADAKTLEIEFTGGGIYHYLKVARETFEAFIDAPSPGIYFAEHILVSHEAHRQSFPVSMESKKRSRCLSKK